MTVSIHGTVIFVPQTILGKIRYPDLDGVVVIHDAGFSGREDKVGNVVIVSGTRILAVEVPCGDIGGADEKDDYPVLECHFTERALVGCSGTP